MYVIITAGVLSTFKFHEAQQKTPRSYSSNQRSGNGATWVLMSRQRKFVLDPRCQRDVRKKDEH